SHCTHCNPSAPSVSYHPSLHDALPICQRFAVDVEADTRAVGDVSERAIAPVAVEEVAHAVIRHEDVGPPIAIDIAHGDSQAFARDRKSTRLNSSHVKISYAVFCLKKKK